MAKVIAAVRLGPGHPIGTYRRGGQVFHVTETVELSQKQLTDEIRNDEWLIVTDIDTGEPILSDKAFAAATEAANQAEMEQLMVEAKATREQQEREAAEAAEQARLEAEAAEAEKTKGENVKE